MLSFQLKEDLAVGLRLLAVLQDLLHDGVHVGALFEFHLHLEGHEADGAVRDAGVFLAASSIMFAQLAQSTSIL